MVRNGYSLHPMSLSGGPRPTMFSQTELLNLDEGNIGFHNSINTNNECFARSGFSFPEQCSISNQSVILPSTTNIPNFDASSSFQPSIKVLVWSKIIFINNVLFISLLNLTTLICAMLRMFSATTCHNWFWIRQGLEKLLLQMCLKQLEFTRDKEFFRLHCSYVQIMIYIWTQIWYFIRLLVVHNLCTIDNIEM
jgi:hypothetical protein